MTLRRLTRKQLAEQRHRNAYDAGALHRVSKTPVTVSINAGPLYVGDLYRLYIMSKYGGGKIVEHVILDNDVLTLTIGADEETWT